MFEIFPRLDYKKIVAGIFQNWDKLGLPPADINKLKVKLLPFRKMGLHSLLNFMVFSENQPLLVIKMPRYKEGKFAIEALKHEANILDYLKQKGILKGHIPQVYKLADFEGIPVLLTKAYHGEMLHHFLDKEEDLSKLDKLIMSGAELLPQLYSRSESKEQIIDEAFIEKYIKEPLKSVVEYYPKQISKIEEFLSSFFKDKNYLGMKYPRVCLHREFNPWNILKESDGNLIVLDWEDAAPEGLPFLDIYNYFTVCFRILFTGETKHSRNRNLDEKKKRTDVLLKNYSNFVGRYCESLNIQSDLKDFFFIIFAINATHFFIEEKRREINYGKSWLSLLLNASLSNCFETSLRFEAQGALESKRPEK